MIENIFFYLIAIPSILLFGISKGGFGGGLGILTVPLMSLIISPSQAAAITLPILCVMDLVGILKFRKNLDFTNLKLLVPSSIVGIIVGYYTFGFFNEKIIRILIGILAVSFSLSYFIQKSKKTKIFKHNSIRSFFWGSLGGFTSFVAHAGGPPINIYLLPQKLEKTIFVGTTIVLFMIINYLKLIPYYLLGQLNIENLITSLILMPLAPIGVLIGYYLHNKISLNIFYRICYISLFITGLKLIF